MKNQTSEQPDMAGRSPIVAAILGSLIVLATGCGDEDSPVSPPPPDPPTANVYILPGAIDLGPTAFGNHPVVIYQGERMRWQNADTATHHVVADAMSLPEFETTGALVPGGERSFVMRTVGTTPIRCTIHPGMTGTLIVQER